MRYKNSFHKIPEFFNVRPCLSFISRFDGWFVSMQDFSISSIIYTYATIIPRIPRSYTRAQESLVKSDPPFMHIHEPLS